MRRLVNRLLALLPLISLAAAGLDDTSRWLNMAKSELREALDVEWNTKRAKNVIMFVGDGMGPNTVTAARIYKHGEEGRLSFERFPHVGLLKTYCNNMQVPDSASTATALFSGVKVNYETVGVDASVELKNCRAALDKNTWLDSLVVHAMAAGMSTGFVTTTRVTHATPSALYAHSATRHWECEDRMPPEASDCKDIARQLVEDEPGRSINVIMGGGRQCMTTNSTGTEQDPIDTWACTRKDGRDLIKAWAQDKEGRKLNYAVVQNDDELRNINVNTTDYVLGIFSNGHMRLEHERNGTGMPSITEMTEAAIKILKKNKKGFFLMVEGGNIDLSHHRGNAKKAIDEAATMDEAVKMAMSMTNLDETLIVVTSDHTHTLAINGYAKKGANIFGLSRPSKIDGKNYTTLSYTTGDVGGFQYTVVEKDGRQVVERRDPSQDDVTDFNYVSQAAILVDENTHGGGEVIVYAKGPHGHLFHNVHEQHYVPYAIKYAAGLDEFIEYRPNASAMLSVDGGCFTVIVLKIIYIIKSIIRY